MPTIRDFKIGDRMVNAYECYGTVISITHGTMKARFTDVRKKSWIETYNADWFRKYGDLIKRLGPTYRPTR